MDSDSLLIDDLFDAIEQNNISLIAEIVNKGADLECEYAVKGYDLGTERMTPLCFATYMNHVECVQLLLELGADVNHECSGISPLGYSVNNLAKDINPENVVKLLLSAGANVDSMSPWNGLGGVPVLVKASYWNGFNIVKMLLDAGANPNVVGSYYGTPLLMTAVDGAPDLKVVKLLLQKGANPNMRSEGGGYYQESPLLQFCDACDCDLVEAIQLLLSVGADVNAKLKSGETLLQLAKSRDAEELAELLVSYGAVENVEDADDK